MDRRQNGSTTETKMKIKITSNGKTLGTLTCETFRKSIGAPKNMFLPEVIQIWNARKTANGEPERAEIEI